MQADGGPRAERAQGNWERWIDKMIREAIEAGQFDGLRGAGRPIDWEDESLVDDAWVMAFRIMREQGFAPEWIELAKEIRRELTSARATVLNAWRWRVARLPGAREGERRYIDAEWRRARTAFAETVAELNVKIADFNLKVPIVRLQKFKLEVAQELADLGIDA
jgi:DnaJ family protein C protein 28